MTKYLIVCPLVFLAAYIDAIAGGGGLISLPAYLLTGLPTSVCIGTNKMSACMGTTVTTVRYAKKGFIPWKLAALCVPCSLIGSVLGADLALIIGDKYLKIIMLFLLPATAIYVLTRKELSTGRSRFGQKNVSVICMTVSFLIGTYDGFYGPGTGTFLILLLTAIAGLNIEKANGLTKAVNFASNVAAFAVYLINGRVLVTLGLVAAVFSIAGGYLGATRFAKGGSRIARPVILIVIGVFFVKVLLEFAGIV